MEKIKVSEYVARFLEAQGVRVMFELSGGMIAVMLDSIATQKKISIISCRHEQAAAFAADAVGRLTGIPGVAMATSGPGAVNLLTGVGSCHFDSSPAVFITGQVNTSEQKGNRSIRQLGFQETDVVGMVGPITKAAWRVTTAEEVPEILERAFRIATEGRPGPVLIDIPLNVQRASIESPENINRIESRPNPKIPETDAVWKALLDSERPLLLVGGGIRAGRAADEFRALVESVPCPVVHSLMAVDVLPFDSPSRIGMIGSYGNRWANTALHRSDLIVVMGSRLDVRQTGAKTESFKANRRIFHIDCEEGELNNRVAGCETIQSEILPFLKAFLQNRPDIPDAYLKRLEQWREEISGLRQMWPDTDENECLTGINPNALMHQLSVASKSASTYVVDVGQHQMWAAQSLELTASQRFITSGGMGSMGFALPASIGAAVCQSGKPVVMIAGDGGFQCNIQELQTVSHHSLPIKMVVVNNGCHGMVRQFQESYFQGRFQSTLVGYSAPSFVAVAQAFGIAASTISTPQEIASGIEKLWEHSSMPFLLEVRIDTFANAYPKMLFNEPINKMEPKDKGPVGSF